MNRKIICILFGLLVACSTFAESGGGGNSKGNGGDAVVCRDNNGKILTARLLDFYEAEQKQNKQIFRTNADNENIILKQMVLKIKPYMPKLSLLINSVGENILQGKDTKFVDGIDLVDIEDSYHNVELEKNCKVEQVAIQFSNNERDNYRFLINSDIYDHFSPIDRAGLVFHEALYYLAGRFGNRDSRIIRSLTAFCASISAENFMDDPSKKFMSFQMMGHRFMEFGGFDVYNIKARGKIFLSFTEILSKEVPKKIKNSLFDFELFNEKWIVPSRVKELMSNQHLISGYGIFKFLLMSGRKFLYNGVNKVNVKLPLNKLMIQEAPQRPDYFFERDDDLRNENNSYISFHKNGEIKNLNIAFNGDLNSNKAKPIELAFNDKEYFFNCSGRGYFKLKKYGPYYDILFPLNCELTLR